MFEAASGPPQASGTMWSFPVAGAGRGRLTVRGAGVLALELARDCAGAVLFCGVQCSCAGEDRGQNDQRLRLHYVSNSASAPKSAQMLAVAISNLRVK
jgi:hypothetical protein